MKISGVAVLVCLYMTGAEAFGPVKPPLIKTILHSSYLDQLGAPASPTASSKPKPAAGGTDGYLDQLTAVSDGRPVLTDGAFGVGDASAPPPPASAPPPPPAATSVPVTAAANPGGYLAALGTDAFRGTGAGMTTHQDTLAANSAMRGTGAGLTGYHSTLASNSAARGPGLMSHVDTLQTNSHGVSGKGFASPEVTGESISSDAASDEYINYLREASIAAKEYLTYLDGATKAAKDYLEFFEKATQSL